MGINLCFKIISDILVNGIPVFLILPFTLNHLVNTKDHFLIEKRAAIKSFQFQSPLFKETSKSF
jgi:hypothetical protein